MSARRLWVNLACYPTRRFCTANNNKKNGTPEGYGPNESLHVASVAVASYLQQISRAKGTDFTPANIQKIEHDVQDRLRVVLGPLLGCESQRGPKRPSPKDPSFVRIDTSRRNTAKTFFADMDPNQIWATLSKFVAGKIFLHGEDVVAGLLHASHTPVGANNIAAILWKIRPQLVYLRPRHVGCLFTSLYRFKVQDKLFFRHVYKHVQEIQHEIEFREMAEIVICSVNLPFDFVPGKQIIDMLQQTIKRMTTTMTQITCKLLHALACSRWQNSVEGKYLINKMMSLVIPMIRDSLTSLNAIDVAQSLEALHVIGELELKRCGVDARHLIKSLCGQGLRTIDTANILDIAELLRAANYLQDFRILDWLYARAGQKFSESTEEPHSKALNDILSVISRSTSSDASRLLCSQICNLIKGSLSHFKPIQLCHVINSCSLLQVKDTELLLGLCDQICRSADDLTVTNIIHVLDACVGLQLERNPVVKTLLIQAARIPRRDYSDKDQAKLVSFVQRFGSGIDEV